jgi:transcriptional regulator with XRE-family HTH domain
MDNVKTGLFIKELRKGKNMTQKELAELLHVTDRAVSKWERGLCAPDISLLEPLAAALGVTIVELLAGKRTNREDCSGDIDSAVKNIIDYSENEIAQKVKAFMKKMIASVIAGCLILLLLIPTLNGLIRGDGFAWRCIPAYLCAEKAAMAIETGDAQGIRTYIGNSDGMFSALSELERQGVDILDAEAKFFRTRLDDMFLWLEMDLTVMYTDIRYQFTCAGTYRNGKVEFMNIVSPSVGRDYPQWILQLNDALSTYDPG